VRKIYKWIFYGFVMATNDRHLQRIKGWGLDFLPDDETQAITTRVKSEELTQEQVDAANDSFITGAKRTVLACARWDGENIERRFCEDGAFYSDIRWEVEKHMLWRDYLLQKGKISEEELTDMRKIFMMEGGKDLSDTVLRAAKRKHGGTRVINAHAGEEVLVYTLIREGERPYSDVMGIGGIRGRLGGFNPIKNLIELDKGTIDEKSVPLYPYGRFNLDSQEDSPPKMWAVRIKTKKGRVVYEDLGAKHSQGNGYRFWDGITRAGPEAFGFPKK